MDLLEIARREGVLCHRLGCRRFGPVIERREAVAIAVAALFELQDANPGLREGDLLRGVRTRVLSAMRDEARERARVRPLGDLDPTLSASTPESRLDRAARAAWLEREIAELPMRDRDLLAAELHDRGPRCARGARPASRLTRWRCLRRVVSLLQARALTTFAP